jgi:hypothetical protein
MDQPTQGCDVGTGRSDDRARLRRRRIRGLAVAVASVAIFAGWLALGLGGSHTVMVFDDTVTAFAAMAAMVLCFRAGLVRRGRIRRFWLLLGAAAAAWTVAEVIWEVYDVVLRQAVPIPSWADVGYLGAIPLAVAALVSHPAMHEKHQLKTRAALDGVVLATALLFLSWSFVLGPLWRHTDLTTLGGVVAVAYPFGDIVILFLVVLVVRSMHSDGRFALWCVLAGLLAMAAADSTYVYLSEMNRYVVGNLVDTGWVAGYLGLALGAYCSTGEERRDTRRMESAPSIASLVLPFVPVLVALVVSAVRVALGEQLLFSDWVMALALTLFVLARQALVLFDGLRPGQRDEPDRDEPDDGPPPADDWAVPVFAEVGSVASEADGR